MRSRWPARPRPLGARFDRAPRLLRGTGPWHTLERGRGDLMRPQSPIRRCLVGMTLAWGSLTCQPLSAETLEELDALSDLSADESAGITAAREQAGRGEYLEALATLERVLAAHPK